MPEPPATPRETLSASALEECLNNAGHLVEVDRVYNNDTTAHGAITAFSVSEGGSLGVASEDGVVKFWTLDEFVGSVNHAALSYGAELAAAPADDLAFFGEELMLADTQGLVTGWYSDGSMRIVGGTEPGVAIRAVASDDARARVAHAEDVLHGRIMVRGVGDDAAVVGPLPTSIDWVSDLAFFPDGRLVVVGATGVTAVLEIFSADLTAVVARYSATEERAIGFGAPRLPEEVTVAGDRVIVALLDEVQTFDATLRLLSRSRDLTVSRSVSASESGRYAFVADESYGLPAGIHHVLTTFDTETGVMLSSARLAATGDRALGTAASVRTELQSGLVFVAFSNGDIVALACQR